MEGAALLPVGGAATPPDEKRGRTFGGATRVGVGALCLLAMAGVAWVSGVGSRTPDGLDSTDALYGGARRDLPHRDDYEGTVRHLQSRLEKFGIDLNDIDFNNDAMRDYVSDMPGLDGDDGIIQFAGYLNVTATKRSFYILVLSQGTPKDDPLVLWTNGGPGCSGLIGYLSEHGPYRPQEDLTIRKDPYSWTEVANMLYIESPTGVGFSHSKAEDSYAYKEDLKAGDESVAKDNLQLIKEFYGRFPDFAKNDFYLSAESYGGHYIPTLTKSILNDKKDDKVHMKGFIVGNPYTDPVENMRGMFGAYWGHQMVPAPMYKAWLDNCADSDSVDTYYDDSYCYSLEDDMFDLVGDVDWYGLDYPVCNKELSTTSTFGSSESSFNQVLSSQAAQLLKHTHPRLHKKVVERWESIKSGESPLMGLSSTTHKIEEGYDACIVDYMTQYLNKAEVKDAFHADSTRSWSECSGEILYDAACQDDYMEALYKEFLEDSGLRIMVFSGDDDSICAPQGTQSWIWKLGFDVVDDWRAWYYTSDYGDGQVGGYHVKFNGTSAKGASLTFVTVRSAGHEVSMYQPFKGFQVFKNYIKEIW